MNRNDLMTQWDYWRKRIASGDTSSAPRDWFESVIDEMFEDSTNVSPIGWVVYWGIGEKRPSANIHTSYEEAQQEAQQIKSTTEIRPVITGDVTVGKLLLRLEQAELALTEMTKRASDRQEPVPEFDPSMDSDFITVYGGKELQQQFDLLYQKVATPDALERPVMGNTFRMDNYAVDRYINKDMVAMMMDNGYTKTLIKKNPSGAHMWRVDQMVRTDGVYIAFDGISQRQFMGINV